MAENSVAPNETCGKCASDDNSSLKLQTISTATVNNVVHTTPDGTVSDVNTELSNLGEDEHLSIDYPLSVGRTPIKHPSHTTIFVNAPITQKPDLEENGTCLIENANPSSGDSDIQLVGNKYLDANAPNQPSGKANCFTIYYQNVTGLHLENITVKRQYDWAARIEGCEHVSFSNFRSVSEGTSVHSDGLHFADTTTVVGSGVYGVSEDDLLAITCNDNSTVSDYKIDGVVGTSLNANIVRINKPTADMGDGSRREFKDIEITGIVGDSPAQNGIVYYNGDENTHYTRVDCEGSIRSPGNCGFIGSGHMKECDVNISVEDSGNNGFAVTDTVTVDNCRFTGTVINPAPGRPCFGAANMSNSVVDLRASRDTSGAHVRIESGENNSIHGAYDGGDDAIWLGTGSTVANGTLVSDVHLTNIGTRGVYDVGDSGHTYVTGYQMKDVTYPVDLNANSVDSGNGIKR